MLKEDVALLLCSASCSVQKKSSISEMVFQVVETGLLLFSLGVNFVDVKSLLDFFSVVMS